MAETGQFELEQTTTQSPSAAESVETAPQKFGRDWLWGLLVFGFFLTLLAAVGVTVVILLAVVLPSFNLHTLILTFPPTASPLLQTISGRFTLLQLAVGLLLFLIVLAFLFYLLARWRILRKVYLWPEAGCPACGHETLVRVHRRGKDRLYAWVGIPVRRYHCRECRWHGLRIHRGAEHFGVSDEWVESLGSAQNSNGPGSLALSQTGEHRRAVLGTIVYNGSNEKWIARLNDMAVKGTTSPLSDESAGSDNEETATEEGATPSDQEDASQREGSLPRALSLSAAPGSDGGMDDGNHYSQDPVPDHVAKIGRVTSPFGLNLRAGPESNADLLGLLEPGAAVLLLREVTGNDGAAWHQVQIEERQGWVLSTFVEDLA